MRDNAEKTGSTFGDILQRKSQEYKDLFRQYGEQATRAGGGVWFFPGAGVRDASGVLAYLQSSIKPTAETHEGLHDTQSKITSAKRLLTRNTFAVPDDLSKFYKRLRDTEGVMFGDIVSKAVADMYDLQDPGTTPLMTQVVYLEALSRSLFPEIKQPRWQVERLEDKHGDKKLPRPTKLIQMLQEDFDLLATMQVMGDYYRRGLQEARVPPGELEWKLPQGAMQKYLQGQGNAREVAYIDVPALELFNTFSNFLDKTYPEWSKTVLMALPGQRLLMTYLNLWRSAQRQVLANNELIFWEENGEAIDKLPPVDWKKISFSREVPSCQKTYFENYEDGIFLSVDPAPGKAYIATVSLTNVLRMQGLEAKLGSLEAARGLVNPLQRPFHVREYLHNLYGLAFYVRKDGELAMYGDSTQIAKSQLGKHYDRCKHLIHHALYNLVHAEYEIAEPSEGTATQVPAEPSPLPEFPEIPSQPAVRIIDQERTEGAGNHRVFQGRTGHTRLLAQGWIPGVNGWISAKKATETIDLRAVVFGESGAVRETIHLPLGDDFETFRQQLLELKQKYGERIRFQTYVEEADDPAAVVKPQTSVAAE